MHTVPGPPAPACPGGKVFPGPGARSLPRGILPFLPPGPHLWGPLTSNMGAPIMLPKAGFKPTIFILPAPGLIPAGDHTLHKCLFLPTDGIS